MSDPVTDLKNSLAYLAQTALDYRDAKRVCLERAARLLERPPQDFEAEAREIALGVLAGIK
jgi:hypothetical protein